MNTVISYIHLLGCMGWTIFWLFGAVPGMLKNEQSFNADAVLFSAALVLPAISGIYLFAVGCNSQFTRLNKLKLENAILEKQIEQATLRKQLEATQNNKNA